MVSQSKTCDGPKQICSHGYNSKNLIETHYVKLHSKFGSPSPNGFRLEDFQRFPIFLSFIDMATRVFEGIKFFQETL